MLRSLKINEEEFYNLFVLTGADDIQIKLDGLGFETALNLYRQKKLYDVLRSKYGFRVVNDILKEAKELKKNLNKPAESVIRFPKDSGSMLWSFLIEEDDGVLRRP